MLMNMSFAEQLTYMFPKPESEIIVRHIRNIYSASAAHGYLAKRYVEYADGHIKFLGEVFVAMTETNVRRREAGASTWEEKVPSCPGWFRCEAPLASKIND